MKHKFHKVLCLVLALTMVAGLLPTGLFASAAAVVEANAGLIIVDDDFATAMDKQVVETKISGVTYRGIKGTTAFATMAEGINKTTGGGSIYVGPGYYKENLSVNGNLSIYGANMNINPNNEDWSLNPKRADASKEAIYEGTLTVTSKTFTRFVFNGFSVTGTSTIAEKTSGGSVKGLDISYNRFYDTNDISSTQGIFSFINSTYRAGQLAYNRIENTKSAKPLTLRNGYGFYIHHNYINANGGNALWISAEMADGNATPGNMKIELTDNYISAASYAAQFILHTAESVDIKVYRNTLKGTQALYIQSRVDSTIEKNIDVQDNVLTGSTNDFALMTASVPYMPSLVNVKNNVLTNSKVTNSWEGDGALDLSYNYFGKGNPSVSSTPAPILYPQYKSSALTELTGDMQIDNIALSAIKPNGDRDTISGIVIDNENKTVSIKDDTDSIYSAMEINAITKASDAPVKVEYYSDAACTKKLTDGNVIDYLKKGSNLVYIKLITSLDDYSYRLYTLTIPRVASHDSEVMSVQGLSGTVTGDKIAITVPAEIYDPNIQLTVSAGASYQLFTDAACTKAVNGTILTGLKAGRSTYYVKVVAEDGTSNKIYQLELTRSPSTKAEVVSVDTPEFVDFDSDENAFIGVYSDDRATTDIEVTVSEKATWKLFSDSACTAAADTKAVALNEGDNVFYIQVSSEAAAVVKTYKLVLHRESVNASKEIKAVTGSVISSSVGKDEVSVVLDAKTKSYTPSFEFVGSKWKLYETYAAGVLSNAVANNTIADVLGGKHTYYIEVIAKDGSTKVYTFAVERKLAADAKLIEISGGTSYYIDRFDFNATTEVKNEGAFTPTFVASDRATVKVLTAKGTLTTLPLMLRPGLNEYKIVVTAENGIDSTAYQWTITCVGEGYELLKDAVAVSTSWTDLDKGTPVYAVINGETKKAYVGENAFATLAAGKTAATANGKVIYVMPGTALNEKITLDGIRLLGANYDINPNLSNRFSESVLLDAVTVNGAGAEVSGFTFAETAKIIVNAGNTQIANNIFEDNTNRTIEAITANKADTNYDNLVITDNYFKTTSDTALIALAGSKSVTVSNNTFETSAISSAIRVGTLPGSLQIVENIFAMPYAEAICADENLVREGALVIRGNEFTAQRAISMDAAKATNTMVVSFNENKVDTTKVAVQVSNAPAAFSTNFFGNQNTFSDISYSFMVDYASSVATAGLNPIDIQYNYYSTATPGNDWFDAQYEYKPYYTDAALQFASNTAQPVIIKADGRAITDDGRDKYIVIPSDTATVTIEFDAVEGLDPAAYGTAYIYKNAAVPTATTSVDVTLTGASTKVYAAVTSLDETVTEISAITLYKQSANPVYGVYDVVSSAVSGMNVTVVVSDRDTAWTPSVAVINNAAIAYYSDAACTKKLTGAIKLTGDCTTVYGKVEGFEPVTFSVYKKLSGDKAILSLKDAYEIKYTGSDTLDVSIDDRKAVVDLTAAVSAGAKFEAYTDAACTAAIADITAVDDSVATIYYKVIAADASFKVFTATLNRIAVTDPTLLAVKSATTQTLKADSIEATVAAYNATEGFPVTLDVNTGCTYKLYADAEHELVLKNNTAFFAANYVYIYAAIKSPDGVKTQNYTIKLNKPAAAIKFVDNIPAWAKDAVAKTKDLGIVTGTKTSSGYKLDATGKTTREMMACFIARMLGIDVTQYSYVDLAADFADADQISSWALNSMKTCVALGIFGGTKTADGYKLTPKDNITREQFAAVFVRAIKAEKVDVKAYKLTYKDASAISSWAAGYVKIMSKLGYMKGSNGKFNPKSSITRAEIIQTIANYMK